MIKKTSVLTIVIASVLILSTVYFYRDDINYLIGNQEENYELIQIFPDLQFSSIVGIQSTAYLQESLFIVEQKGKIQLVSNFKSQQPNMSIFLDIESNVFAGGEMGLLGLTFDPNFQSNGFFYVDYTLNTPRRTRISRFTVESFTTPLITNISSEFVILEVNQPYTNHNAGDITFGNDGYLYITLGDGGSSGDPLNNGQNRTTLLGSILRIDVSQSNVSNPYIIPDDNPFVGNLNNYREEIFAYGFRNPWRISFDFETGNFWVGDVGQNTKEEISLVEKGKNYGWNIMEGDVCFISDGCERDDLVLPIWSYGRNEGYAVTGGYIYRGNTIMSLKGKYVFGDYGSGKIWLLTIETDKPPEIKELFDTEFKISTFGIDVENELYVADHSGRVFKIYKNETITESTNIRTNDTRNTNIPSTAGFDHRYIIILFLLGIKRKS